MLLRLVSKAEVISISIQFLAVLRWERGEIGLALGVLQGSRRVLQHVHIQIPPCGGKQPREGNL